MFIEHTPEVYSMYVCMCLEPTPKVYNYVYTIAMYSLSVQYVCMCLERTTKVYSFDSTNLAWASITNLYEKMTKLIIVKIII